MKVYGLCGCCVEMVDGLVLSAETCSWCLDLALMNVKLARNLQYGVREGREARRAGVVEKAVIADCN